jgi:hypothetical protein
MKGGWPERCLSGKVPRAHVWNTGPPTETVHIRHWVKCLFGTVRRLWLDALWTLQADRNLPEGFQNETVRS